MNLNYCHIKFEQKVEQSRQGNTQLVRALIAPLEEICESLGGCRLLGTGSPERTLVPSYPGQVFNVPEIERSSQYLVGATWVRNEVSLVKGVRLTLLAFLDEYTNQKLIDRLKELYGEENMQSHSGTKQATE